jgi:hypothetical protein
MVTVASSSAGGTVPDLAVQATLIDPVDVLESLDLDVIKATPRRR